MLSKQRLQDKLRSRKKLKRNNKGETIQKSMHQKKKNKKITKNGRNRVNNLGKR